MPAGSGIIASQTLTPDADGVLIVTITFDSQGRNGSDWGSAYTTNAFCTQSGVTSYSPAIPMSTTRSSGTIRGVFNVTSGASCEIGIYGNISGAVAADWYNVHITAELIKR